MQKTSDDSLNRIIHLYNLTCLNCYSKQYTTLMHTLLINIPEGIFS